MASLLLWLLAGALGLAAIGTWIEGRERAAAGMDLAGVITDKPALGPARRADQLTYRITAAPAEGRIGRCSVRAATFDRLNVGDAVQIRLVPDDPDNNCLVDEGPGIGRILLLLLYLVPAVLGGWFLGRLGLRRGAQRRA